MDFDMYNPQREGGAIGIDVWLETHIDIYETQYRNFWGLRATQCPDWIEESAWRHARHVDAAYPSFLNAIYRLASDEALRAATTEFESPVANDNPVRRFGTNVVVDRIPIDMAWEAVGKAGKASHRFWDLTLLARKQPLGSRASAYLERITRLYLWGFDPEAIALCASALESALEDAIGEQQMRDLRFLPSMDGFSAYQYAQAARRLGLLSEDLYTMARDLRRARNDIMHNVPVSTIDPFMALVTLSACLRAIFPE
jgi:hypothetical protein